MLVLAASMQAQDLKIMVNKNGKVGFSDSQGKEVIKCQYTGVQPFVNGMAIVSKGEKTGMIDATGKVLLPLKYSQVTKWHNDLYLIKKDNAVGLANGQGQIVLPVTYSFISKPNCFGKAFITSGGIATIKGRRSYMAKADYGIVDDKGNILIRPQYKGLFEFTQDVSNRAPIIEGTLLQYSLHYLTDTLVTDCQYLGVQTSNASSIIGAGIVDATGNQVVSIGSYNLVMKPKNGIMRFYNLEKERTICGYHHLDTGTKLIVTTLSKPFSELTSMSHSEYYGDMAVVNEDTCWCFIDREGKQLRSNYQDVKQCKHLRLWAGKRSDGKWEVFDFDNKDIENLSGYEDISFPSLATDVELFSVKQKGKYGCVDRNKKTVIPFVYAHLEGVTSNLLIAKKQGKWGAISTINAQLIPFLYKGVMTPNEAVAKHIWVMGTDSLYYHYNLNTKKQVGKGYKIVTNFSDNIAYVIPKNLKLSNTPLYRAQMFVPNTPKEKMDSLDISTCTDSFGFLINSDDQLLSDLPISYLYKDKVLRRIKRRNPNPITKSAVKQILLNVTQENRSYSLSSTIEESEWSF